METLNEITKQYLKKNGISAKFFEEWIGCNHTKCNLWLKNNERKLSPEQIRKVHEFLDGKHIKTVEDVLKEDSDGRG